MLSWPFEKAVTPFHEVEQMHLYNLCPFMDTWNSFFQPWTKKNPGQKKKKTLNFTQVYILLYKEKLIKSVLVTF